MPEGKNTEQNRKDTPPRPESRISKDDRTPTKTPCLCGCGEMVPRTFAPGHDMRLVTYAKEYVRGERELTPEQTEYVESSGKLDRARKRVAEEDRRRVERDQEKVARKAEKSKAIDAGKGGAK